MVQKHALYNGALNINSNRFYLHSTAISCSNLHGWKLVALFLVRTHKLDCLLVQNLMDANLPHIDGHIDTWAERWSHKEPSNECVVVPERWRGGWVHVGGFFFLKGWKGIMEEKGMKKGGKGKGRHKKRERWRLWFIWLLNDDSPCGESPSHCPSAVSEINGGNREVTYTHLYTQPYEYTVAPI